jgi:hypothetical protein
MSNPQPRTWTPGTARQVIEAAYEAGVRIFDSARAYATLDDPVHSDRITAVMQGAARLLNGPVEFPVAVGIVDRQGGELVTSTTSPRSTGRRTFAWFTCSD